MIYDNSAIYGQSYSRSPFDSIRDALLTVSPNKQYLGMAVPTTPAATGPKKLKSPYLTLASF